MYVPSVYSAKYAPFEDFKLCNVFAICFTFGLDVFFSTMLHSSHSPPHTLTHVIIMLYFPGMES